MSKNMAVQGFGRKAVLMILVTMNVGCIAVVMSRIAVWLASAVSTNVVQSNEAQRMAQAKSEGPTVAGNITVSAADGNSNDTDDHPGPDTATFRESAWCPQIHSCNATSLCDPCRRRFLIIIATPRSASTTLQHMMDSLPGLRVSGENNGAINQMHHAIESVRSKRQFADGATVGHSWVHNPVPPGRYACVTQEFIEAIAPPLPVGEVRASAVAKYEEANKLLVRHQQLQQQHRGGNVTSDDAAATKARQILASLTDFPNDRLHSVLGFKTVRFIENKPAHVSIAEMVDFVKESFPCSRIIVNYRSAVQEQVKSYAKVGWKDLSDKEAVELSFNITRDANQQLQQAARMFGSERAVLLDTVEWTKNISKLNEVVSWLGYSEECYFDHLLQFNTKGYSGSEVEPEYHHKAGCRYLYDDNMNRQT